MTPAVGYTEMQDSGIEWVGEIPAHWAVERIQWHLDEINESNNPVQTTNILSLTNKLGVVPYEEKGNQGNKSKENFADYKIAYPNTIVANSMNILIGSVGLCEYHGCVSPVYYVFKEKCGNSIKYLNYLFSLTNFQKELRKYANGILEIRLRVSSANILKRKVAMPSFEEQTAIAAYLDTQCAKIDEIIAEAKASIEDYKQWKASIIYEAVTKGLDPDAEMKDSGIPHAGEIPQNWSVSPIKYVAMLDAKCDKSGLSEETKVSFAPMECIRNDTRIEKVALVGKDNGTYSSFHDGDIAIAKVTPCFENGNICIMENLEHGYAFGSSELFSIRPKNINSRYLLYCMQTPYFVANGAATMTGVGGLKRVSSYYMKNALIPLPSQHEQDSIVAYLDNKSKTIVELIAEKELLIADLESYKKSLIYEVVTGKRRVY